MNILRLWVALSKSGLLSISGVVQLVRAIRKHGLNLMTLLQFAANSYGPQVALIDDEEERTYGELLKESMQLSVYLKEQYSIQPKQKVGLYCRNDAALVKAIFALSRLGANLYLINAEVGKVQFQQLAKNHSFKLLIYDEHVAQIVEQSKELNEKLCIAEMPVFTNGTNGHSMPATSVSNLILLTSGTTGTPKEVVHKPSLFNYLHPFLGMVERLKLTQYNNGYIATPLYHGYGIAILLLFITLGKKVILSRNFDAKKACLLVRKHQVEIITVVPLMIQKMLKGNVEDLKSLRCIASGGAVLSSSLVKEVKRTLGDVLYNLYGTSETGLNMIATPEDLSYSAQTIGKGIKGMNYMIATSQHQSVERGVIGQLYVKSKGSMVNPKQHWISTGDLMYQDNNGYYFLVGRQDDMIVSAGENVYPIHVENTLQEHPCIEDAVVIGVADEQFGQRLHAFIQKKNGTDITEMACLDWLRSKVARYEIPRDITFIDAIPYTALGKRDKKQLSNFNQ